MVFNGSGDIIETKLFREPKVIIKKSIPKYRGSLTSKSKTFDFVNLPKVLRSKEVCNNLQSNFDISDIPMVVYYLSPSIRSTFFNYKQFVLHLNIDEFLKDPNLIKCCCNKYDNSFINNHYVHIITGNLDIVNNERLCKLISKGPKHREPKKNCFEDTHEEIRTNVDQFIERASKDKSIHKNHFSNWKSHVMSSMNDIKFHTLKNKLLISSINKPNQRKAAKSMSILNTKIPHDKEIHVLNKITDFAFKGATRDYVTVYNSGAFWSKFKSKTRRLFSARNKILFGVFNKKQLLPSRF